MAQLVKRSTIFVMALVVFLSVLSRAENAGKALIGSVEFRGVKALKAGDIKKVMDTKFPGWLPFAKKPALEESILKSDMKSIETYYRANGYFDASASYTVIKSRKNAPSKLVISITEGRPSIVDRIIVSASGQDEALLSKLDGLVELERGKRFRYTQYEESKKKMQRYLSDNGYGSAAVTGKARVNKSAHSVDAVYSVNEGRFQRFGEVHISGNKEVRRKDIADELVFKPADEFSNSKLDQSRNKIFSLGIFRSVSVTPVISSASAVVPVNVEVVEGDKRQVRLGIGYAPEAKIRTSAQWSRFYLFGRPRTLTLGAAYSAIEESVTAKVFQPYFLDRLNSMTVTGSFDKETAASYTNEKISSQFQVKRDFQDNLSVFTAYNLEVNKLVNLRDTLLSGIFAGTPGSSYFISSLSAGLNYAFVDSLTYPSHGFTYSQYFEPATFLLGSEVDYLKGVSECHLYGVLFNEVIVASRFKFGFIRPSRFTADIPIFKRFFSGGSYSVRGYGFQQIGPKDASGNPLGGQYLFEGNIEFRYPIMGNLKGVVFADSGEVYQSEFIFNAEGLSYGVGTGVRYVTPIGPLGIDLAFPVQHFNPIDFSLYYLYLTIGQGF